MSTKEVVKTSILSTRWKNLWTSLPIIDFDDDLWLYGTARVDPDLTSFVNFVEIVLRLQDTLNIEKFRLSCCAFRVASQIHSWISHAIMHNVQELDLYFLTIHQSVIPRSMFDSTSLVTLKINMICVIEVPSHVSFPCLKTLHISSVRFWNDDSTEKLFSGCPVLEELVLLDCNLRNLKNIAISSSTLKSLIICDPRLGPIEGRSGCKIKIDTTNLTYFEYTGFLFNQIFLNNTPSLVKSFIEIPILGERLNKVACRAIYLFKQLQCVVSLTLSNHNIETLLVADNISFPMFRNLKKLMLVMEIGMKHMVLLSFCPVLQSICFSEGFMHNMHLGKNNSIWSSIPICLSNCLKTVTLKKFHGYNSEIFFLKCVLENACVLERVNIVWSESCLLDLNKTKATKDLGMIEKTSKACVINFS